MTESTFTSEGHIPHLILGGGEIVAPVKLVTQGKGGNYGIAWELRYVLGVRTRAPIPLRRNGRLVYALPGGGETQA